MAASAAIPNTSNPLERVNRELKRHTRVAGLFPNEASPLRLVSAPSPKPATSGKRGKFTSTWNAKPSPPVSMPCQF
jgi:transposase-like protein